MGNVHDHKYINYRKDKDIYEVCVTLGKRADGKRNRVFRTSKTLKGAIEKRDSILSVLELGAHEVLMQSKLSDLGTLESDMLEWYNVFKSPYMARNTNNTNLGNMNNHLFPYIGSMQTKEITRMQLQVLFTSLQKNGNKHLDFSNQLPVNRQLSYDTLRLTRSILNSFFKHLVNEEVIDKNPCTGTKLLKVKKEKKYFTPEQVIAFLDAARDSKYYMLFKLLFETGCRRSEVLGLPWRNVDFESKTIYIQQTLVALNSGGKEFELKSAPKNESSKRYIPVSDDTCRALIGIKREQQSRKGFSEDSLVFQQSTNKEYVQPSKMYQRFKQVLKKAGLDKELTIHSTRHTMATRLINSGVSIPTIQKLGGWSTPDILLKVYAHTSQENVAEAVKLLQQ